MNVEVRCTQCGNSFLVGESEVFAGNLPGFPDGVSSDGRGGFWLALFTVLWTPQSRAQAQLSHFGGFTKGWSST